MIINRHTYSKITVKPSQIVDECAIWVCPHVQTFIHVRACQFRGDYVWVRTEYADAYGLPYEQTEILSVIAP